jgi:hypothetical protein
VLAGVGVGGLALALAVPHVNRNTKSVGTNEMAGQKEHESLTMLITRLGVMTLCLLVLVIRILIPLSAIWRARDPFRTNEPGAGRILVVL